MALQCDYIEQHAGESNRIDCDVPAFISKPPRLRMQCYAEIETHCFILSEQSKVKVWCNLL